MVTDDRHAESHLVAKQMLRHPIAYTVLVLPICATPYCAISSAPALFPATVSATTVFLLSGFVNVVLFCTTRKDLPGSWKQKFGIGTTLYSFPGDINLSSRTVVTRCLTKTGGKRGASMALDVVVEKDVEIKYDVAEPEASSSTFARNALPTKPLPAHDSMQREDTCGPYIRDISFLPPICIKLDVDYLDKNLGVGVHPASRRSRIAWDVPHHPVHSPRGCGSGMLGSTLGLEAPSRVYPSAMPPPVNTNERKFWSPSISTTNTAADQAHLSLPGLATIGSGNHCTRHNRRPPQTRYMGIYPSAANEHPHFALQPSIGSRCPGY